MTVVNEMLASLPNLTVTQFNRQSMTFDFLSFDFKEGMLLQAHM